MWQSLGMGKTRGEDAAMLFRGRRRHAAAEPETKSDAATLARSTALQSDELTCAMTRFDASIHLRRSDEK